MTKLEKIKAAVRAGSPVHEGTPDGGYMVKCCSYHGHSKSPPREGEAGEQWLISFAPTGWCIGLTHTDEKTLNGKQFYLNGEEILGDPCDQSKSPTSGEASTALAANSTGE